MSQAAWEQLVLGLDVGANSVGWALVAHRDGGPAELVRCGSRVFEAGVEGDIESGKDESRAVDRRTARHRRRMLERTARRLTKLARLLQGAGLLPDGELSSPQARQAFFCALDRDLAGRLPTGTDPAMLPYYLRRRALDERLEAYEIGRALYHLGQRRGFLSNRKEAKKAEDEEEEGKVKAGIAELEKEMAKAGARTLGEYLSGLDPHQQRIRQRYTSRQMYLDEFEQIWQAQRQHHPTLLTDDLKKQVHRAIFYQRPLKNAKGLIGECDLEPGQKRAPWALLCAQRFRLLQKVNDLELIDQHGIRRRLTQAERSELIARLEANDHIKFSKVRTLLGLPKGTRFNFEETEDRLIGNRTAAKLLQVFGPGRWGSLSAEEKDRVVEDLRSIQKDKALISRAQRVWGLDPESAKNLAAVKLEDGYCSLSRKAIERLLPLMEKGMRYAEARVREYGEAPPPPCYDSLPPFDLPRRFGRQPLPEVRNPAVERALNEVRRVVNAIIRQYGKPDLIRVEFVRELKKSRKERKAIASRNLKQRSARDKAKEGLLKEAGIQQPTGRDIEKWLLAEECRWQCPYTGRQISVASLFGPQPEFDVEHIIPFDRCLDNSFFNKTLCEVSENRNVKGNRTPWEAYGGNAQRWEEILQRVRKFTGPAARAKLERFQLKDLKPLEDFAASQLNAAGYVSRLAREYLGLLYGASANGVDPQGKMRVQVGRGRVTNYLRDQWGLNALLGGAEKRREDHRHHAMDAVLIALTDHAIVKRLSDAAKRAPEYRRRNFAPIDPPWPGFYDDVKQAVENIVVSHRVSRKVSGPLHEETYYGRSGDGAARVRKPLNADFKEKDIEAIVDPVVRERVREHFEACGKDAKKAFGDPDNPPFLIAKDGRRIPIRRVRLQRSVTTHAIGQGPRLRHVALGSNHHLEVLETKDKKGRLKWEGEIVPMLEAVRRLRAGEPVIKRDHGPDKRFVFSLAGGDTIELERDGKRELFVVRSISITEGTATRMVEYVRLNDARRVTDIKATKDWFKSLVEPLRKAGCRKVVVGPLGDVFPAND